MMQRAVICFAVAVLTAAGPALGTAAAGDDPPPTVTLDQLLTLPSSHTIDTAAKGGATRVEWQARFAAAEANVEQAKSKLDESLAKMAELAQENQGWKVSAPGAQVTTDDNSPLSYGLSQEVRRRREEVERSERALTELTIEANLAGVPEEWQSSR